MSLLNRLYFNQIKYGLKDLSLREKMKKKELLECCGTDSCGCHYSKLDKIVKSINKQGFFEDSFITLRRGDNNDWFLVDGNHRLNSLIILGQLNLCEKNYINMEGEPLEVILDENQEKKILNFWKLNNGNWGDNYVF
tara:strand:+ start:933 stop:1343 length:411 start_codon:yes stop_codon:yes gene_type:complete